MKKIISIVLVLLLTIGSSSIVFAGSTYKIQDMNSLKKELISLPETTSANYELKVKELEANTDPKILNQFIEEKFELVEKVMSKYETTVNSGNDYIDLGDNCYIKIKTNNIDKDFNVRSLKPNTPGAETVWQKFGEKNFTAEYSVNFALLDFQLFLSNDYKLSKDGIKITSADAWMNYSGLASGSAGEAKITKASAKTGKTASSNAIFVLEGSVKDARYAKNFRMYNNLKCSSIDTIEKEVKVVKSWNGKWI